jgi:transcription antitermination factor NusG
MFNDVLKGDPGLQVSPKSQPNDGSWYAIYTKSRFEKKVFRDLAHSQYQVFLPLVTEKKHWSDRIKSVSVPLFPSYVFVKLLTQHQSKLYNYPGVVKLVSFEGNLARSKRKRSA